jgi:aspartate-semialdehyde dehydrogenase
VNIELHKDFKENDVREMLTNQAGVVVIDNPSVNAYPMPLDAEGKDEVFVGRIRRDYSQPNTFNCWIVADNLRKGAATNAVQIAKLLHNNGWI